MIFISLPQVYDENTIDNYFSKKTPVSEKKDENIRSTDFSLNGILSLKSDFPELDGSGIFIAQKEHTPDLTDIDILNNYLPSYLESTSTTSHATRVAAVMVGRGISSPLNEGVVPNAKVFSVAYNNLSPENDNFYLKNNISVINNSFGTEIEPYYGQNAVDYDAFCYRNPEILFVFSSGNIGFSTATKGKYANLQGFSTITGNYKMSKNTLTVGAINQYKELSPESSRGPAHDGRIKPEVVAFSNNGTSEAAAITTGIVSIAQQVYKKETNTRPSSSLIKAILINTAEDIGTKGVDFQTGFGSLNIRRAVESIRKKEYWESDIMNNSYKEITLNIPKNVEHLKITLTWIDPPSKLNTTNALVNNLDLLLTTNSPIFTAWQPWVLNSSPQKDSLQKIATRKRDNINNIEQITVEKPIAGSYKVIITGQNMSTERQNFSVAYSWDYSDDFVWTYPVSKSKIIANQPNVIRWQSTLLDSKAKLEFSINNGQTWQLISSEINLNTGYYEWNTPNEFYEVILRFIQKGKSYSTKAFTISPIIDVNSNFFCSDSTQLFWNFQPKTNKKINYNIYRLDTKKNSWLKYSTTEKENIIISATKQGDSFAVEPIFPSGLTGLRSSLISSKTSGISCFYRDFTTSIELDKIRLSINLTTNSGIKYLVFQKVTIGGIIDIEVLRTQNNNLAYSIFDSKPDEGVNNYRTKIIFENGKIIYTQLSQVFYSETEQFWVYPTPLHSNDLLNINSNVSEIFIIKIFNVTGILYFEKNIYNGANQLNLSSLPKGNYFYTLSSNDSFRLKKGKISILP